MTPAFIDCLIYWTNSPVTQTNVNWVEVFQWKIRLENVFQTRDEKYCMEMQDFTKSYLLLIFVVADGIPLVT